MRYQPLLLALFFAACADAEEVGEMSQAITLCNPIWVSPTGGGDGCSSTSPLTLAAAVPSVDPGDTVMLLGGYYGQFTFTTAWSGAAFDLGHVTVMSADPNDPAIFDPGFDWAQGDPSPWISCEQQPEECDIGPGAPHDDEYVSERTFDDPTRWGTLLGDNVRLLAYSRFEDFRSDNESDLVVPRTDERPGFPIDNTPNKRLHAYRGPGLFYDENGKVHIRLSHTHLGPGVDNYAGPTDPNTLEMSIASEGQFAAKNFADHIQFVGIVFQNGEDTVVESHRVAGVHHVSFDHCTFRGGRHVVRLGNSDFHTFVNCEFSALLGPWVSREDVKLTYPGPPLPEALAACVGKAQGQACSFAIPDQCPSAQECDTIPNTCSIPGACDAEGICRNEKQCHAEQIGSARTTATMLVLTNGSDDHLEIANCELRDGHDGIQAWGTNTNIHHNLLENLNDSVFFIDGHDTHNLEIHDNVIRRALNVFAHEGGGDTATDGARYYYRNILDLRTPTLGRHLTAEASEATGERVWRFGVDFKMNQPIGEFYFFHNTVVQANPGLDALSFAMSDTGKDPRTRRFVNNVHVTFDGNKPLLHVPSAGYPAIASGNILSRRRTVVTTPLYVSNGTPPSTWVDNQFAHPPFINVPDYGLPRNAPYENTDYRLSVAGDNPACDAGVPLDFTPPPSFNSVGDSGDPDLGALPCGAASPVRVGIQERHVFPIAGRPIAEAGDYATIVDADGDGLEPVVFDASASTSAVTFEWRDAFEGALLGTTAKITRSLTLGTYQSFLEVADGSGQVATDMREVTVAASPFPNLLLNPGFESGAAPWALPTGGALVTSPVRAGNGALRISSGSTARVATQTVAVGGNKQVVIAGSLLKGFPASQLARVQVEWLASGGTVIGLPQTIGTGASLTSFKYVEKTLTSPSNCVAARVRLVLDATVSFPTSAFFDDLSLRVVQ